MDAHRLKLLKEQIAKIEDFKSYDSWGPEYKIWQSTTERLVQDLFNDDYLKMFKEQRNIVFADPQFNKARYLEELDKRERFLTSAIKEFERLENDSALNIGRSVGITDYDLHPRIKEVVGTKYEDGHYAETVESAFKEVIKRVKDYIHGKTGERLDGAKAMGRAFDFEKQEPLVKFNEMQTQEEQDEQRGIALLFKGIVFIRNRKAHENIILNDPFRALEYLALASLLMRLMDDFAL